MGGGFASGVGELDPDCGALGVDELYDGPPSGGLVVIPYAGIVWANPSLRGNGAGLGHDQPETTSRPRAQVDEMPVADNPVLVLARVHTHGRKPDPVSGQKLPDPERGEDASHMPKYLKGADIAREFSP